MTDGRGPVAAGKVADEDRADDLLARAAQARKAEARALRKVDKLLSVGDPIGARAVSTVARDRGADALRLTQAAHAQREHELRAQADEARLAEAQISTHEVITRTFLTGLGFKWSPVIADAFWATAAAIGQAEPADEGDRIRVQPPAELDAAREEIEATWRKAAREDALVELAEEREAAASAAITASEPETAGGTPADFDVAVSAPHQPTGAEPPDDGLPLWRALPEDWKRRYSLHKQLGRVEYSRELRRRERDRRAPPRPSGPARSSRYAFKHPGLLP